MTMAAPPSAVPQILLKVRFASVDRTASLSLGMNLLSTGAGNTIGAVHRQGSFLRLRSASVTKRHPNHIYPHQRSECLSLSAGSESGSHYRGARGEEPGADSGGAECSGHGRQGRPVFWPREAIPLFPVVQSSANGISNVTIQFREFGIRLNFTPTITPRGTIKLEVAPEVSSLDYANGLTYQGFNIPGLDVRRVKTEIELENNQSFAIAGLLDNTLTQNLSKIPGLGDIPLLGKLFQSQSTTKNNSEILVVVTPELVQPISQAVSVPALVMPKPFHEGRPKFGQLRQRITRDPPSASPRAAADTF